MEPLLFEFGDLSRLPQAAQNAVATASEFISNGGVAPDLAQALAKTDIETRQLASQVLSESIRPTLETEGKQKRADWMAAMLGRDVLADSTFTSYITGGAPKLRDKGFGLRNHNGGRHSIRNSQL